MQCRYDGCLWHERCEKHFEKQLRITTSYVPRRVPLGRLRRPLAGRPLRMAVRVDAHGTAHGGVCWVQAIAAPPSHTQRGAVFVASVVLLLLNTAYPLCVAPASPIPYITPLLVAGSATVVLTASAAWLGASPSAGVPALVPSLFSDSSGLCLCGYLLVSSGGFTGYSNQLRRCVASLFCLPYLPRCCRLLPLAQGQRSGNRSR